MTIIKRTSNSKHTIEESRGTKMHLPPLPLNRSSFISSKSGMCRISGLTAKLVNVWNGMLLWKATIKSLRSRNLSLTNSFSASFVANLFSTNSSASSRVSDNIANFYRCRRNYKNILVFGVSADYIQAF